MRLKEASVLIVDDEAVLREIMSEWFELTAHRVFCAADGQQALEILSKHKIDLIVTDVRMPVMNGITLLKKVKASGSHPPVVIFVTGFADIKLRDVYDLGAEALVEKPMELDYLLKTVEKNLLGPNERWRKPHNLSRSAILSRSFSSLPRALREHRIAFGRGGFALKASGFPQEGPVNIELNFQADGYTLTGQGIVRWLAHKEDQMGIELTYVSEGSRARLVELTKGAVSFIPASTGHRNLALAS